MFSTSIVGLVLDSVSNGAQLGYKDCGCKFISSHIAACTCVELIYRC